MTKLKSKPRKAQPASPNESGARISRAGVSMGALVTAALGGALFTGAVMTAGFARSTISADTFRQLDLFGEVFEQVHENYVEKPEDSDLIKGAINGMLSELDPHSSFLDSSDYDRMQEQTRGSFAGLGIQVVMDSEGDDAGYVKIVAPIDDTPAAKAGLQTNDLIVEIDGEDVLPMSIDDAISKLKGPKGSPVEVAIVRNRDEEAFDVKLVRDIIKPDAVTARAEGDFGYLRVRTFSETTETQLLKGFETLEKEIPGGPKGYVLDLRSNPGGLLDQAVAVSDAFLDGGEIVSTRGRNPKDTLREMGTPGDKAKGRPVIILINGGSASASEIVAGAIQDRNRGLLLGTDSFGKGSVQTVIPLQNGLQGALRLTTARYYTPSGKSIQAKGIQPDIAYPVLYPGQDEIGPRKGEKDLPNALDVPEGRTAEDEETAVSSDSDSEKATAAAGDTVEPIRCDPEEDGTVRDCQLEKALDMLADTTGFRAALADAGNARTQ